MCLEVFRGRRGSNTEYLAESRGEYEECRNRVGLRRWDLKSTKNLVRMTKKGFRLKTRLTKVKDLLKERNQIN